MKHYCLHCGKELEEEQLLCPKCEHCSFLDAFADSKEALSGALAAQQIEANTQWMKYKCGRNNNAGHGFAAEDYNGYYHNPVSLQHPLSSVEIVPSGSSWTLVISKDKTITDSYLKIYPKCEDLSLFNQS